MISDNKTVTKNNFSGKGMSGTGINISYDEWLSTQSNSLGIPTVSDVFQCVILQITFLLLISVVTIA